MRIEDVAWPKPAGPDLEAIATVHPAPDGMIALIANNCFKQPYYLRAGDLQMLFPAMLKELIQDSFFSLNALQNCGNRTRRTNGNVKYLNLCWSDLDCYTVGLRPWDTIGKVGNRMDDGLLPPISGMVKSGNGLWVFWLLQANADSDLPVPAVNGNKQLWNRIQQTIYSRLSDLGADASAKDASRVARIHGSINSKNPNEPVCWLFLRHPSKPARYTLKDLADWFKLAELPKRKVVTLQPGEWKAHSDNAKVRAGKLSYKNQVSRKLRDWQNLCIMRNGYREGKPSRNVAAYIGASLHLRNGHKLEQTRARMEEFNSTFKPPLSREEFDWAIKKAVDITRSCRKPFRYESLRDRLKITRREAAALEGDYYPVSKPTKKAKIEARRAVVGELLRTVHPKPSLRALQKMLEERGIEVSFRTVWKDHSALKEAPLREDQQQLSFARDEKFR